MLSANFASGEALLGSTGMAVIGTERAATSALVSSPARNWLSLIVAAGAILAAMTGRASAAEPASPPADYSQAASWLCRPGQEAACTQDLDAMAVKPDGTRVRQSFAPAADPPIDCFYVYPTVSRQPTVYADMSPSPEIQAVARGQAGRLASRCRLFVPIYRQRTLFGIADTARNGEWDWSGPLRDVSAAWNWYLAHNNHGRGVVLIGHSQGTLLLQKLIADEIDGKPAQARLVSAFLAGAQSLQVPSGEGVGGSFKHIPLCAAAAQTGCVYVWGSYLAGDPQRERFFGNNGANGLVAACANPAAPAGGNGALKAYLRKPAMAPADEPPWVEVDGQLTASCIADDTGNVLRVSVLPTRFAPLLNAMLQEVSARPRWGLHRLDVNFVLGNILNVIDAQTASWMKPARRAAR
jgi:hypothetical protein